MDIADLEEQLEGANRVKEDGLRQLKKYQQQVKDIQRDLDEARHARDEISEQAKENERKAKQLEADYLQMQEVRSGTLETVFMGTWLSLVPVSYKETYRLLVISLAILWLGGRIRKPLSAPVTSCQS